MSIESTTSATNQYQHDDQDQQQGAQTRPDPAPQAFDQDNERTGSLKSNLLAGTKMSEWEPSPGSAQASTTVSQDVGSLKNDLGTNRLLSGVEPKRVRDLSMKRNGDSDLNPADGQQGFAQKDERWAGKDDPKTNVDERTDYSWANDGKKFANVGCTVTALTNGLRIAHPTSNVTPDDAHKLEDPFNSAFKNTSFTDLSGQGKEVKERWFNDPQIEQMKPQVHVDSEDGQKIIDKAKESLRQGQPVLLGFRDDPSNGNRHSVLAVGASEDGKLRVIDSWDGKVKSLDDAIKTIGADKPMFDYAYSMRPK